MLIFLTLRDLQQSLTVVYLTLFGRGKNIMYYLSLSEGYYIFIKIILSYKN